MNKGKNILIVLRNINIEDIKGELIYIKKYSNINYTNIDENTDLNKLYIRTIDKVKFDKKEILSLYILSGDWDIVNKDFEDNFLSIFDESMMINNSKEKNLKNKFTYYVLLDINRYDSEDIFYKRVSEFIIEFYNKNNED